MADSGTFTECRVTAPERQRQRDIRVFGFMVLAECEMAQQAQK